MAGTVEEQMYKPFIRASNLALDRLSKLDVPGLGCSKAHDDDKILFHQNDPKNMTQQHQGERSIWKPDVVIVSRTSAKKVRKQLGQAYKDDEALEKPTQQFQWTDVRSTVEFKHKKTWTGLLMPPETNAVKDYDIPAATSSHQTSDARGRSTSRALNNKRRHSSQTSDGRSNKKLRVDDDSDEEELQRIHPVLQNVLYARVGGRCSRPMSCGRASLLI